MDRETFWNGFYFYIIIQGAIVLVKSINLFELSWWLIFIPTYLVILGGFFFVVYFWFTCNPRIEKVIKNKTILKEK